jgi:hypothetical protein
LFCLARAGAVVALAGATATWLTPAAAGALAFAAAAVLATHRDEGRRLAAIEDAACLAFLVALFGLAGAGAFAVVRLAISAPLAAAFAGMRPTTALALAVPCAALAAAAIPFVADWPPAWQPVASLAPALALAAPAHFLDRIAGRRPADRLDALGPMLVALVIGAGAGGLAGAAAGWAAARLATPLALRLLARPRRALLMAGLLAAGVVAGVAAAAGLALGGGLAAAPAAAALACLVYGVALRVHAPAAARRLARRLGRVTPAAGPARTRPFPIRS